MAYLGIGYCGDTREFSLGEFLNLHSRWLKGDRLPRMFGDGFVVLYDSNTAREFARKCRDAAPADSIVVFPMSRPANPRRYR